MVQALHYFCNAGCEVPPVDVEAGMLLANLLLVSCVGGFVQVNVVRLKLLERSINGMLQGLSVVTRIINLETRRILRIGVASCELGS